MVNKALENVQIEGEIKGKNGISLKANVYIVSTTSTEMIVKVILKTDEIDNTLRRNMSFPATIEGKTEYGDIVYISGFYITNNAYFSSTHRIEWIGKAEKYFASKHLRKIVENGKIHINLTIPFTTLTSPRLTLLPGVGKLSIKESKKTYLKWSSKGYKYTIFNTFKIDKVDETTNLFSLKQIVHSSHISIVYDLNKDVELLDEVLKVIKDCEKIFSLIGFIGKRRIDWYKGEITILNTGEPIIVKAQQISNIKPVELNSLSFLDCVLTDVALGKGSFKKLLEKFSNHEKKDAINRSIGYLLSSYENGYLFTQLVAVYTSFETLVTELGVFTGIDTIITPEKYKLLEKSIKKVIKSKIECKITRGNLYEKIPELKRLSIKTKFFTLFDHKKVPLTRFIFSSTEWEKNMTDLINRRNALVHQGTVTEKHFLDLFRVQLLIQLWILNLLECPNEYINEHIADVLKYNRN